MPENKTIETDASVQQFLDGVANETRQRDAYAVLDLMRRVTGAEPRMWGPSIVGFGSYHYRYDSGREGDAPRIGFSPRKAKLALYLTLKGERYDEMLAKLGKHSTGASCLYVNRLSDADQEVLETMIRESWEAARLKFGEPE
jgi:hypothetical protein